MILFYLHLKVSALDHVNDVKFLVEEPQWE